MNNSIKLILRNLFRKPVTAIINIAGLSVSFALVLILMAYSYSEFTTDQFHKNHKNIYLIDKGEGWVYTPALLKSVIDNQLPQVEKSVRIRDAWRTPVFQANEDDPVKSDLLFADTGFFELFDYRALEGNLKSALNGPMSVVISKSLATRLFGNEKALGKTIKLYNKHFLTVSGVFDKQIPNTIFKFNAVCSLEAMQVIQPNKGDFTNWRYNNYQTFLLVSPESKPDDIMNSLTKLVPESEKEQFKEAKLIPLDDIYFSKLHIWSDKYIQTGNKTRVWYLIVVALLVLTIALINFINITTTHWSEKIRQTGVMKIMGAKHFSIVGNMLLETLLLFSLSFVVAFLFILPFSQPLLQNTTVMFNQRLLFSGGLVLIAITGIIALSLLCGIIPSVRIASSSALINLKKKVAIQNNKTTGRGILVTMQFGVAIVLILFTILVQKQVDFGSSSLGMNQENIVGVEITDQLKEKQEVLRESLKNLASVDDVVFTEYYPGEMISGWGSKLSINGEEKPVEYNTFCAEPGFFKLMGTTLLSGSYFTDNIASDKNKVVVNEQFVREYGISNAIGAKIWRDENTFYEIVGVVKNFHFRPVNEPIMPLVIRNEKRAYVALARLKTGNFKALRSTFENITKTANELSPNFPADVTFFDKAIQQMYVSEVKFQKVFTLFSLCAIVISSLGILALSLFAAQQRIKEIGIRKVNGAKVSEIMAMLNKDFIKWVLIAFVVAMPVAYYAMTKWLESFAYKTTLSWWIFALAGLLSLGIALLTVSWQSWRAATRNPVEALRYE